MMVSVPKPVLSKGPPAFASDIIHTFFVRIFFCMLFPLNIFGHYFDIMYLIILSICLDSFHRISGTFFNQQNINIGQKSMYHYQNYKLVSPTLVSPARELSY